jgi:hypothetical protein
MPIALLTTSLTTQMLLFVLAFVTLKYRYGNFKKAIRIMCYYFLIAGFVDIIGFTFAMSGIQSASIYRIFNIVEFVLLAYMFFLIESELGYKIIVVVLSCLIFVIITSGNMRELNNTSYSTFYMALSYLTLAIMSIRSFYWTMISKVNPIKDAQLWATMGFMFYFSINAVAMLLWTPGHIIMGTYISITANIIKNLIILWSYKFLLMKQS